MVRSFDIRIKEKSLLSYASRYLDNALMELQSNDYKIIDVYKQDIEEYNYPNHFNSIMFIIVAETERDVLEGDPCIRGNYFGNQYTTPTRWQKEKRKEN